ncbi:MAG: DNA polymerase III subunit beta [Thermoanaerobaculia bacterium]|jgi:DNA polymerase-3 subunit beta
MEFTVTKSDLQKELQLCQGVVERRSTIPILSNVLLKASKDRIELAATDLDVTLQTSCGAAVKQQGMVTIDARRFFDIVRSLPEDDVKISLDENYSVQVESGSAKFRILGLPAEDYPTLPKVDRSKAISVDLQDLKTMVEKVIFAITHEETRFQLNGALLKLADGKMEMVATDGHRMALVTMPLGGASQDLTILIPRKALNELLRLDAGEDGGMKFGTSENHLFFEAGGRCLMARMMDVNFPNYMEVVAKDNDRRVTVTRERLLSSIKRVSLVANERTRAVRFDFAAGKLTVSSTSAELGDARETVPIEYTGAPFHVGLNASYVADFLAAVDTDSVALDLKDENSQCIARPLGGETLAYEYVYIVMPMRIG